ncbi:lipid kinase [Clostridia bacterium]|nr:lipid kinase [Clostridia bacterium]
MKHIFIINPAAGNRTAEKRFLAQILSCVKAEELDYEIHRTTGPGEAESFIRTRCEEFPDTIRFYACGGDGTLNEVLNGAFGYKNAEITVIPAGTGNDFVRNFPSPEGFLNLAELIKGSVKPIDIMSYAIFDDNSDIQAAVIEKRFALNMCNFGFDSDVVARAATLKTKPFIGGTMAYIGGVFITLMRKKALKLSLRFDDGRVLYEKILLTAVANGAYCGGGFKSAPKSEVDDGLLDIIIVRDMSRRTFLSLVGKYHNGTHMEDKRAEDIILYKHCRSAEISSRTFMNMAIDGEVKRIKRARVEILPKAINFCFPVRYPNPA